MSLAASMWPPLLLRVNICCKHTCQLESESCERCCAPWGHPVSSTKDGVGYVWAWGVYVEGSFYEGLPEKTIWRRALPMEVITKITCCNLASLWIARVHREAVRSSDFRSFGFDGLTSFNPLENLTQVFCVPAAAPKISMLSVQCTFDPSKAETKKSRTPHRAVNIPERSPFSS